MCPTSPRLAISHHSAMEALGLGLRLGLGPYAITVPWKPYVRGRRGSRAKGKLRLMLVVNRAQGLGLSFHRRLRLVGVFVMQSAEIRASRRVAS